MGVMAKPNMDGFASPQELRQHTAQTSAFRLGRIHKDHNFNQDAGIKDDRHIFMVAGSRAGKGTTIIIPNLIDWTGGAFCIDPKGENASITAMRRGTLEIAQQAGSSVKKCLGQKVAILDPFNTVRGPARKYCVSYDPLGDIDITSVEAVGQIETITEGIVVREKGKSDHWSESGATILAGIIETVKITEDKKNHTLPFCRSMIIKGFDAMIEYLRKAPNGDLAPTALDILLDVGEEEMGSFKTTLSRQLKWMNDRRIRNHLNCNDDGFSLVQAVRENWSIYVCIPPRMIPRFSRWLRILVNFAFDAKMASPFDHKGEQTLFILDEFSSLGNFPIIEDAAAYMAGYGIKLVPVIQNIGQVKKLYERNWETFLGNAGGIIAWGLNDLETEKYVSDRLGQVRVYERSYGASTGRDPNDASIKNRSESDNLALRDRAIRWPNQIHKDGAREEMRAFIIPASGPPFMVERVEYMARDKQGLFDSPDYIARWEKRLVEQSKTPG